LKSPEAACAQTKKPKAIASRTETVERRFGLLKHVLGVWRFMRRGLEAVRTEWLLICTAVNLGVLLREWARVCLVL
jgi:hypothetical protein